VEDFSVTGQGGLRNIPDCGVNVQAAVSYVVDYNVTGNVALNLSRNKV